MSENELKRLHELKELIEKYDYQYYELGESEITDAEYDRLYLEYSQLEAKHQEFAVEDSPTKKVGAGNKSGTSTGLAKLTHKSPLLSINTKGKTLESLRKFYEDCGGDRVEFIVEPKYDGITVNVNYENGKFVNAATRGNGYIGELVSANFLKTSSKIPSELPNHASLELRGEAIIPLDYFNAKMKDNGYKNPRNAASGLMRTLELNEHLSGVKVVFYDIGQHDNLNVSDQDHENVRLIKELGFNSSPVFVTNCWEDLKQAVESNMNGYIKNIDGFNVLVGIDEESGEEYPKAICDGLVIKVDDLRLRKELGMTEKGPRWAYAHKFKSLQAETGLVNVVWNTGKSGKLTPVAKFNPVNIGGTTISFATLNNYDFMKNMPVFGEMREVCGIETYVPYKEALDLIHFFKETDKIVDIEDPYRVLMIRKIKGLQLEVFDVDKFTTEEITFEPNRYCLYSEDKGLRAYDTLVLERSNDVIPKIIGIKHRKNNLSEKEVFYAQMDINKNLNEPTHCPSCRSLIEKNGANHFCTNHWCVDKAIGRMTHFASRDCMNIVGLGESLVLELVYHFTISDLYVLKKYTDELMKIEGMGEKKIQNLLDSIEASKKPELWRFIHSLSIPGVGKKTAKDLAEKFKEFDILRRADQLTLLEVEGIGESTANSVYQFFKDETAINLIDELLKNGVEPQPVKTSNNTLFAEKTFVITGTLKHPRSYYQDLIESAGGKVAGSVSKKTDVILVGEDAGSKETKARQLVAAGANILILDNEDSISKFFNDK